MRGSWFIFLLSTACALVPDAALVLDPDGDGSPLGEDCDDDDADVHPGAEETCGDGKDNDCDGVADDTSPRYVDEDGDGYGAGDAVMACEAPSGAVSEGGDCDDEDPAVNPAAQEVCDEAGVDEDCDGQIDDADDSVDAGGQTRWYADGDGDGYGAGEGLLACEAPSGFVEDATDCDDTQATVYPGAEEDCADGLVNDCEATSGETWAACQADGAPLDPRDELRWPAVSRGTSAYGFVAVAPAGDVCDDHRPDMVIGTYHASHTQQQAGAAYVVCGDSRDALEGIADLSDAWAELRGTEYLERAGTYVAGVGDVNCDNHDDLLVSAYFNSTTGDYAGAVYLVEGRLGRGVSTLTDSAAAVLYGEEAGDEAGRAISALGDLDGDGCSELLVGATYAGDSGAAYLIYGCADCLEGAMSLADVPGVVKMSGETTAANLGGAAGVGANLNTSGDRDFVLSSPGYDNDRGRAYVFLTRPVSGVDLSDADAHITGQQSGEGMSARVTSLGDFNGDGADDIALSAYANDREGEDAGAVYVVLGGSGLSGALSPALALYGEEAGDTAGNGLTSLGDVDQDGLADLGVGALYAEDEAGAFYVVFGHGLQGSTLDLSDADLRRTGANPGDFAGWDLAGVGDVDGDGFVDMLVGVSGDDTSGEEYGAAYLLFGGF